MSSAARGRGGRGKAGGGSGQSRRARHYNDPVVKTSKKLSKILRHTALEQGLALKPDGFALVEDVLRLPGFQGVDEDMVRRVVQDNDKQRFALRTAADGRLEIRANQGHTVDVVRDEELLERLTDATAVPICVHGTYHQWWPQIRDHGLKRMRRNHIHFAVGDYGSADVISGMRSSCQVLVYVDLARVIADGIPVYRSANNVILIAGVGDEGLLSPKYFARVLDAKSGRVLFEPASAAAAGGPDGAGMPAVAPTAAATAAAAPAHAETSVSDACAYVVQSDEDLARLCREGVPGGARLLVLAPGDGASSAAFEQGVAVAYVDVRRARADGLPVQVDGAEVRCSAPLDIKYVSRLISVRTGLDLEYHGADKVGGSSAPPSTVSPKKHKKDPFAR